jgi:acetyl-CoA C-acetyltransferase
MEAVNLAANQVRGGAGHAYIAGGVEMMGRVAMGSDGAAIAVDPSLAMKTYFVPQGISADIIATEYGFTRDDADALAVESQRRAAQPGPRGALPVGAAPVRDQNGLPILAATNTCAPAPTCRSLAR